MQGEGEGRVLATWRGKEDKMKLNALSTKSTINLTSFMFPLSLKSNKKLAKVKFLASIDWLRGSVVAFRLAEFSFQTFRK